MYGYSPTVCLTGTAWPGTPSVGSEHGDASGRRLAKRLCAGRRLQPRHQILPIEHETFEDLPARPLAASVHEESGWCERSAAQGGCPLRTAKIRAYAAIRLGATERASQPEMGASISTRPRAGTAPRPRLAGEADRCRSDDRIPSRSACRLALVVALVASGADHGRAGGRSPVAPLHRRTRAGAGPGDPDGTGGARFWMDPGQRPGLLETSRRLGRQAARRGAHIHHAPAGGAGSRS